MTWRIVTEYPSYSVSDSGEIYSTKARRVLKPTISAKGYPMVRLYNALGSKLLFVHVVVATAFVDGKTEEMCVVNHKDENKANPAAYNLEWCTDAYNKLYSAASLKSSKTVIRTDALGNTTRYFSANEAARQTGLSQSMISRACREGVATQGYSWRYSDAR